MSAAYFDASALVKLIVAEPESAAMRRYADSVERKISSEVARVEVIRAIRPLGSIETRRARDLLKFVALVPLEVSLLDHAAQIDPPPLRTLDSIHLARAMSVGDELDEFVTYDDRLKEAAEAVGLPVVSPGLK